MPFITEEIYGALVPEEESLMMSRWPEYKDEWSFPADENVMEHVKAVVKGIRNIRSEMDVPNSRKTKVYIVCEDEALSEGMEAVKVSAQPLMMARRGPDPEDKGRRCGQRGICRCAGYGSLSAAGRSGGL